MKKCILISAVVVSALSVFAQDISQLGAGPSTRYATDAFPGFDNEKEIVAPTKKEPKWFAFWNGPSRNNAAEQYAYCCELERKGKWSRAVKQYDALVREWPATMEAAVAQERVARILGDKLEDYEEAFNEYRYLADFFTSKCDYPRATDEMYRLATIMRKEGKTIIFFRFRNSVDVRRAFETCVLRAPGAEWVPAAMLAIGELREEEGKPLEAIKVYENLRNLHYGAPETKRAVVREAEVRMQVIDDHRYNRDRADDTASFLKLALKICDEQDAPRIKELLDEATGHLESEAYKSARFYDSNTRTKRSAIAAYERFLAEYPDGPHAEEAKERLEKLKQ